MSPRIEQLTQRMKRRPPACISRLSNYLNSVGAFTVPGDYLEFMNITDGATGPVGDAAFLAIFSVDEMIERNDVTRTLEPELIFLGTDRGGEGYAFDLQRPEVPIIAIEFDTLDRTYAKDMGLTLVELLESLCRYGA